MYLRSFCGIESTFKILFSTDKLKITGSPVGIEIPGGERTGATEGLALCLSLEAGVVVVGTISDQIKGSTDKLLLACISSLLCFVHSLSSQSFAAQ